MTFPPDGIFYLGIKKIVLFPDDIIVPDTCARWPIYFSKEFSKMALVGTLIICLYSRDYPVVEPISTLD